MSNHLTINVGLFTKNFILCGNLKKKSGGKIKHFTNFFNLNSYYPSCTVFVGSKKATVWNIPVIFVRVVKVAKYLSTTSLFQATRL